MTNVVANYRTASDGFTAVVRSATGRWEHRSPCPEWDARGVVEHVIGFNDVLLLRPLEAKPSRPKDDPETRWAVTVDALFSALARPGVLDKERQSLLAYLTSEMLVHTWDLAKAISIEVALDERLCQIGFDLAIANPRPVDGLDMFGPTVPIPDEAPVQDRLLGVFGRDPRWTSPT